MAHSANLTVRSYECDAYGHVNNANYLNYLEYARHEYLKAIGFDYALCMEQGYGLYVTRVEIDFKRPALLDDRLVIESRAIKRGAVSGTLEQRILLGETLVAQALVSWAFVDAQGKPTRLPERFNLPGLAPEA